MRLSVLLVLLLAASCHSPSNRAVPTTQSKAVGRATLLSEAIACNQSRVEMMGNVAKLAADRSQGCRADSDCVLVETSLSCQEGCPLAILASARESYRTALAAMDTASCKSANVKCRGGSTCAPAQGASCRQGRCVVNLKGVRLSSQTPAAKRN